MGLLSALEAGDLEQARMLLNQGGDPNDLGQGGLTPLMLAASLGDVDLVQALLDAHADPGFRDAMDETALLKAAAQGHAAVVARLKASASPADWAMAESYLRTAGQGSELLPGPEAPVERSGRDLSRTLAKGAARVAGFFGNDSPGKRLERVERSEKKKGKP